MSLYILLGSATVGGLPEESRMPANPGQSTTRRVYPKKKVSPPRKLGVGCMWIYRGRKAPDNIHSCSLSSRRQEGTARKMHNFLRCAFIFNGLFTWGCQKRLRIGSCSPVSSLYNDELVLLTRKEAERDLHAAVLTIPGSPGLGSRCTTRARSPCCSGPAVPGGNIHHGAPRAWGGGSVYVMLNRRRWCMRSRESFCPDTEKLTFHAAGKVNYTRPKITTTIKLPAGEPQNQAKR